MTGWLQDGTLLGLVRDGRLIPWDHDTDTGVMIQDWTVEARSALVQAGFALTATLGDRSDGWQHRWTRDGEKTDVFFHYEDADTQWHAAYSHGRQYRYTYPHFALEPYDVDGTTVMVPSPPEAFLRTKYGPAWRVPTRDWHFATSPLNGERQ